MGSRSFFTCMVLINFLMINFSNLKCQAQLSSNFYDSTCPNALSTIKTVIDAAVASETRMAASLIRLHFHDCFVQGCDGSVLLADTATFTGEATAPQNRFSIRGDNVINDAKAQLESICPGVVSCADILAVAARDSSVAVNGPSWTVNLGRRDSTGASLAQATSDLPRFSDSLSTIIGLFSNKGLNAREMVALSGAHTIGQAACATFRDRIYGNDSIDPGFATTRQANCPQSGGNGNLAPLDEVTPNNFDTDYFSNIIALRGLLASDQVLFSNGASTANVVTEYSNNPTTFNDDFAAAMVKMGNISPLTGTQGEIRTVCTAVN